MYTRSKEEFDGYMSKGVLLASYMKVFELILRLRQLCDHPFLISLRADYSNLADLEENIKKFVF